MTVSAIATDRKNSTDAIIMSKFEEKKRKRLQRIVDREKEKLFAFTKVITAGKCKRRENRWHYFFEKR